MNREGKVHAIVKEAIARGMPKKAAAELKEGQKLMDEIDAYIPTPTREVDKPFLMPVEDVFGIKGRGTVATGRIERGQCKVGDEVEIIGLRKDSIKTVLTGIEMFQKTLDKAKAFQPQILMNGHPGLFGDEMSWMDAVRKNPNGPNEFVYTKDQFSKFIDIMKEIKKNPAIENFKPN